MSKWDDNPNLRLGIIGSIFLLSGFSSLVFETAWQRLLTLHYGVGSVTGSMIISVFMAGLGMGAYVGGKLADRIDKPRKVYAIIEIALAAWGFASIGILSMLASFTAGASYIVSLCSMAAFLLVPTFAMGMTLPLVIAVARPAYDQFFKSLAFLYALNTLGGAFGALGASFILISFGGIDIAIYTAAALDLVLAGLLFLIPDRKQILPVEVDRETFVDSTSQSPLSSLAVSVMLAFFSGFLAIGYEIALFRFVDVLSKSSPYTFASNLAYYLSGIAMGSCLAASRMERRQRLARQAGKGQNEKFVDPRLILRSFLLIQAGAGVYVIALFAVFFKLLDTTWLAGHTAAFFQPGYVYGAYAGSLSAMCNLLFVAVPGTILGASFPLLGTLCYAGRHEAGRAVGTIYSANTMGNIAGGLIVGFVLFPLLGTEGSLALLSLLGIFSLWLFPCKKPIFNAFRVVLSIGGLGAMWVFPHPGHLYLAMHEKAVKPQATPALRHYLQEGADGVCVLFEDGPRFDNYINGYGHGAKPNYKYHREFFETLLYTKHPQEILVIGFGAGTTTELAVRVKGVEHVDLVEISAANLANMRKSPIGRVFADHRLSVIEDDCRRLLMRSDKKYDMILLDPLRATEAYSNNIYSREFFKMTMDHLKPGGTIMLWLDEHKVLPKTVASVFPYVRQYNYFLIASNEPLVTDALAKSDKLSAFATDEIKQAWGKEVNFVGDREAVEKATEGMPVNEDLRPVCEYFLGLRTREVLKGNAH